MATVVQGTIHGKTIELQENPNLPDGQSVEIEIRAINRKEPWGDGLRRAAGALADDPDWERIMEEVHQERKEDSRKECLE
jgi:hypothetical protein